MIKTQSFNDFSSFSWEQKRDYNFMLQQLRAFKEKGGDASLMVQEDRYSSDKIELITFRDYIMKNIEKSENFFKDLMAEGILPGLCDFEWDAETGTIQEKQGYGLSWMKNNYEQFSSMVFESVQKLLAQLPDDLSLIQSYNEFDYEGTLRPRAYPHPLYIIAETINKPEIYKLIFESKPEIKKEWLESGKFDEPRFLQTIGANYGDVKNPELGILFYQQGIGTEYFHEKERSDKLHQLICYAVYHEDIEFLKQVLPKINLAEMESNKYSHDLSLAKAQTIEIVNLLLDHNAIVSQTIKNHNGTYTTDIVFSEYLKTPEVLDTILKRSPEHSKMVKDSPDDFYTSIMDKKPFGFTELLIKEYGFPLENFDMLHIAWKRERDGGIDKYKWLVQNGADVRECAEFCSSIVNARDTGLKHLRLLNKEGIIVSKSPDILFHIFNSSPTKIFLNYYDKLTENDFEKYTKQGFPAWWGAKNQNDYVFMFSKIKNYDQTAQDGQPLLFYVLDRELKYSRLGRPREIIELQLKKLKKNNPEYKLDLGYSDKDGNNFLHKFLSVKEYGKDSVDPDLLDVLIENGKQNPFEFLLKENKDGISPLEVFLTQDNKKNYSYMRTMEKILEKGVEYVDFNKVINGKKVADHFLELFKHDKEIVAQIETTILERELSQKESTVFKKMKI